MIADKDPLRRLLFYQDLSFSHLSRVRPTLLCRQAFPSLVELRPKRLRRTSRILRSSHPPPRLPRVLERRSQLRPQLLPTFRVQLDLRTKPIRLILGLARLGPSFPRIFERSSQLGPHLAERRVQRGQLRRTCGQLRRTCGQLQRTCGQLRRTCGQLRRTCGQLRRACGVARELGESARRGMGERNGGTRRRRVVRGVALAAQGFGV